MSQLCRRRAVWDMETKTIGNPYELEATAMVVITSEDGVIHQFDQDHIREGCEFLLASPGYVTFNGILFDIPVILKYMSRGEGRLLRSKPHFDIYDEWVRQHPGQRISLDNMARTTLGIQKFELWNNTATSLWRTDPAKLREYNAWDSYITYLLYLHCVEKGYLEYTLPTRRRFVPDNMGRTG